MSAPLREARTAHTPYRPEFRTAFLTPRYWGVWLGAGCLWLLSRLPWRARAALATVLGDLSRRLGHKRREIARVNLHLCYPQLGEAERARLLRDHFRWRMRAVLDYGLLWWGSAEQLRRRVQVIGEEHFRAHYERGVPIILLTPHSLALDFGGLVLTTRYRGISMVKPTRNPLLDWFLQRARQRFGGRLCSRAQGLRPAVRALRQGGFFYYLPDEDLGAGPDTVFAPFFGVPAATLSALGRLAKLTNAVVLPAYNRGVPGTGGYEQHIFPALTDFPTGDPQRDAERMNHEVEKLIALAPEQYIWTLRRFRTRPDGGPNPYEEAGIYRAAR